MITIGFETTKFKTHGTFTDKACYIYISCRETCVRNSDSKEIFLAEKDVDVL